MKQISGIGTSAGVGLLTGQQALQNSYRVVALSRNLATLPDHANLIKIAGSATSMSNLKKALTGSDAVIVIVETGSSTKATILGTVKNSTETVTTQNFASQMNALLLR